MQTMKLRVLQKPGRIELMLESLVVARNWVAEGGQRIRDRSELPSALQEMALKVEKSEGAWQCWLNHDGLRLFLGEMSLALSRERGCPVLQVHFYNEQARLQEYCLWAQLADGTWQRCTL